MASRAARPCSTTGTVKTGPGTTSLANELSGSRYICNDDSNAHNVIRIEDNATAWQLACLLGDDGPCVSTSSVIRSWTRAAKADSSSCLSGPLALRPKRRDASRRVTFARPTDAQIDAALAAHAVAKFLRGPTCTMTDALKGLWAAELKAIAARHRHGQLRFQCLCMPRASTTVTSGTAS